MKKRIIILASMLLICVVGIFTYSKIKENMEAEEETYSDVDSDGLSGGGASYAPGSEHNSHGGGVISINKHNTIVFEIESVIEAGEISVTLYEFDEENYKPTGYQDAVEKCLSGPLDKRIISKSGKEIVEFTNLKPGVYGYAIYENSEDTKYEAQYIKYTEYRE